jgi:hypothetical protein
MQAQTKELKRAYSLMTLALIVGVISFAFALAKNAVMEYWAVNRDNVECIPADVEHSLPMVYRQSTVNPVEEDGLVKTFLTEYIHASLDEQIVSYHALSDQGRYESARLSKAKWKSIHMSLGAERALNEKRYSDSNKVYYELQRSNMGWVFLIDDIIIRSAPNSGSVLAIVRGSFQVTYDKEKVDLPSRLWGYREMYFTIQQGVPVSNAKTELYDNKYGLYVSWSAVNEITPAQKEKLSERSYDYYMLKEFQ